jgi:molybdate transport system ATP-binding protein
MTSGLSLDVSIAFTNFRLNVALDLPVSGTTALFGPSGCGKTTLLRVIAGLERHASGTVRFGDELWQGHSKTFIPPHRRPIGYAFQDGRLFPHLSVEGNLRYAARRAGGSDASAHFDQIVAAIGLGPLLPRGVSMLSGGEKQRVAIGRALLASPKLLLMDEPLASLDDVRKAEIMPYLERLRDETNVPIVLVSHSVAEVARLADTVAVLAEGRLAAFGPTSEILGRLDVLPLEERGEGGAVIEATVEAHDERYGMTVLKARAGQIHVPRLDASPGSVVRLRIRARDVMVAVRNPEGLSALNVLEGRVAAMQTGIGHEAEVRIDCNGDTIVASITRQSLETLGLAIGQIAFAVIKTVSFDKR